MGFNYYLGKITKNKHEKIKDCTMEQLETIVKEEPVRPYDLSTEIYGLGSDFDARLIEPFFKKIFNHRATHNAMSTGEDVFHILSKDGLAKIIEIYHQQVAQFMQEMETRVNKLSQGTLDEYTLEKLKREMASKTSEWNDKTKRGYSPYKLEGKELVNSWKMEYAIFELVHIYRNFDFDKNYLVFYGY